MSNKKTTLLVGGVALGVVISFMIVLNVLLKPIENLDEKNEITKVLEFPNGKEIYVRAKVWGVAGNHEEIVFSENPITISDKEGDFIFYTDELMYKIENNTLIIYAPQSGINVPEIPFKDVEVIFKGLKTAEEIRDYSNNYQKYGLQRISVYKKSENAPKS